MNNVPSTLRKRMLRCTVPAIFALGLPQAGFAQGNSQTPSWEKGYLLQTGVSLAVVPFTSDDRLQHFAAGSAVSAFVTYKTGSFWKGCAAALGVGILKESYDEVFDDGKFEVRDIGYTIAGCSLTWRF